VDLELALHNIVQKQILVFMSVVGLNSLTLESTQGWCSFESGSVGVKYYISRFQGQVKISRSRSRSSSTFQVQDFKVKVKVKFYISSLRHS
jgi:hypothetical protein